MSERDVQIHANLLAEYVYAHACEYFKHSDGLHKCHSLLVVQLGSLQLNHILLPSVGR